MVSKAAENRRREAQRQAVQAGRLQIAHDNRPVLADGRRLSDEELVAKLASFQITVDAERQAKLARNFPSSETLCRWLIKEDAVDLTQHADSDDWIWIALVCLRERWSPRRPSFELLEDQIATGFEQQAAGSPNAACEAWALAWQTIQHLLQAFRFDSIDDLDECFEGAVSVSDWLPDMLAEMERLEDMHLQWAAMRLVVAQQAFTHYEVAPEGDRMLPLLRLVIADANFTVGNTHEADRWFAECVAHNENPVRCWITWAEHYLRCTRNRQLSRVEVLAKRGLQQAPVGQQVELWNLVAEVCELSDRAPEAAVCRANAARDALIADSVAGNLTKAA